MLLVATLGLTLAVKADFVVRPFYVYPSDQPMHPEYVRSIESLVLEIQEWYRERVGTSFQLEPLKVVKGRNYLEMRAGKNPTQEQIDDLQLLPNWWESLQSITNGPQPKTVYWVFAQGGGGFAGANLWGDYQGFATFGDWVLEPISGVREPKAIHSGFATWQVQGGTPKGTTVHELGHAFGLHHPDKYKGMSIMRWHGDYPDTGLLPHEVMILRNSPFFVSNAYEADAPWLDFENPDVVRTGQTLVLRGKRLRAGDEIEFRWTTSPLDLKTALTERFEKVRCEVLSDTEAKVTVPLSAGPGFVRAWRGTKKGNAVPVNVYPLEE